MDLHLQYFIIYFEFLLIQTSLIPL